MAPNTASISTLRARSYMSRIPLFTRFVAVLIIVLYIFSLQSYWDILEWGSLKPAAMSLKTLFQINAFPLIHTGVFHAVINIVALVPLMDRFETENGTLSSLILFFGPLSTIPAFLYVFVERLVLRGDTAVMGASIWVFLLMGIESIRTHQANPALAIWNHRIPTWTMPLVAILIVAALLPGTSTLGHICGLGVGYVCR